MTLIRTNEEIRLLVEDTLTTLHSHLDRTDINVLCHLSSHILDVASWLTEQNDIDELVGEQILEAELADDGMGCFDDGTLADLDEDEVPDYIYCLTTRGCDAGGYVQLDEEGNEAGFIVFSGSIASPDTTRRFATRHPGSFQLRQNLITEGLLAEIPETGQLITTRDLWFETAARAASILAGQCCDSDCWRLFDQDSEEVM